MPRDDSLGADIRDAIKGAQDVVRIDKGAPFATAKTFAALRFNRADGATLHHHRGAFYHWGSAAYIETADADLRAQLYDFLDHCITIDKDGEPQPVKPTTTMVNHVVDGLRAATHLESAIDAPVWLDQVPDIEPADLIPCANGLLHLPTLSLLPLTPRFFALNALDFGYSPNAPEPQHWHRFLAEIWPNDPQSIDTLQEIFGICLTGDTRHQKAFLTVGPKRSGKGTIARVLRALVGDANAVAPTLAALGTNFGLAPLIGKRIAIVSDARLGGRADQAAVAERLLNITGEDEITIDRKYREAWTGKLQIRFLILTNELPRLADASGALASRFIVLTMTKSFYGHEDLSLTDKLLGELPSILNWSLAGLARLRDRGYFVQPASAAEAVQTLEDLGSPIGAFLRDRCNVGPEYEVAVDHLFEAWTNWCQNQGRSHPGTAQTFGRDLRAACPTLHIKRPRSANDRIRIYEGIGIKPVVVDFSNGIDLN
jgi:putative DNA primase/helicase